MLHYLSTDLPLHLLGFLAILFVTALVNRHLLHRARRHSAPPRLPKLSILVPARNEEANIARCVRSLLAQDYPDFELLVLDDESTDRTRTILESLARDDARLQPLEGRPLPAGWIGKSWACAQLAERAAGELLLFTDADTFHQPHALRALVIAMEGEGADLMTGFPRQELLSWGERLLVPFFSWVTYCFTPLALAYRLRLPALSVAVGQALLFRRTAYQGLGGHQAVRSDVAEDLALARRTKELGYRWRMVQMADLVSCRMYRCGRDAYAGLSKNLFAAFGFRLLPYLAAWGWLALLFLGPLATLTLYASGSPLELPLGAILACVALTLALWMVPYRELGLPPWLALCYPAALLLIEIVALRSLLGAVAGGLSWKGRALARPRLRLF